jgi:thiol:disulfide interchange protein DsbC
MFMKLSALIAAFGLAVLLGMPAHAQDSDRIKAELKRKLPEAPVDSVSKVPYGSLYEVIVGGDIFYTDDKVSFLVAGSIIDLASKTNVTEARMRQMNAIKWDALPFDQAIKIVRGNGSRKIAMFEDPNCGYCKRFERDLQGVNDLTVYVFLYPILSPDSLSKSKAVWCAPDRAKMWLDHMVRDAAIEGSTACATPIDKILAFGKDKRIQGTPTVIFENGDRVPGAMAVEDFEKKLAEIAKKPATASAK